MTACSFLGLGVKIFMWSKSTTGTKALQGEVRYVVKCKRQGGVRNIGESREIRTEKRDPTCFIYLSRFSTLGSHPLKKATFCPKTQYL